MLAMVLSIAYLLWDSAAHLQDSAEARDGQVLHRRYLANLDLRQGILHARYWSFKKLDGTPRAKHHFRRFQRVKATYTALKCPVA